MIAWRRAIAQGEAGRAGNVPYTSNTAHQIAQDAEHALGSPDPIDPDHEAAGEAFDSDFGLPFPATDS